MEWLHFGWFIIVYAVNNYIGYEKCCGKVMVDDVVWLLWFLIQIENLEGKPMVVLIILMNTSSIMSTKFACVVDWFGISMVPIISIGYKTTFFFVFENQIISWS